MPDKPEEQARREIDRLLGLAGWRVQSVSKVNSYRMYSMLKGRDLPEDLEEASGSALDRLFKDAPPIKYNPAIPIETFDIIVTDEAHRSIYNLWRQVLEYFDAYLIGLTATPSKQIFGFFSRNRPLRKVRWEQLEEEFTYNSNQLDRKVDVAGHA